MTADRAAHTDDKPAHADDKPAHSPFGNSENANRAALVEKVAFLSGLIFGIGVVFMVR